MVQFSVLKSSEIDLNEGWHHASFSSLFSSCWDDVGEPAVASDGLNRSSVICSVIVARIFLISDDIVRFAAE